MYDLALSIYQFLEKGDIEPFENVNKPNLQRKALVAALAENPQARKYLLVLNAGFVKILQPGEDTLIFEGFPKADAESYTKIFEQYIIEHKDELEALRIIYNNGNEPITYAMLKDLEAKITAVDARFKAATLWNFYRIAKPEKVTVIKGQTEREALTNFIQLVRFAYNIISDLEPLSLFAKQRFNLWCGQKQRPLSLEQINIVEQIVNYIVANGSCNITTLRNAAKNDGQKRTFLAQMIQHFHSTESADETLVSLSQFLLTSKIA